MDTAGRYAWFAEFEAKDISPCYQEWCRGIAEDPRLLELIDSLPAAKRQPNLLLAAARLLGMEIAPFARFRSWLLGAWPEVREVAMARSTQTNEAARAAVLLPVLAGMEGPLSLIEVGASAGMCLYPDRYSYSYDDGGLRLDPADGPSGVLLECSTAGNVPLPGKLPEVVYRAGVDLNPLDASDPEDMRWLEALVWPEQALRRERLAAAAAIVRSEPPTLVRGDLNAAIPELVAAAPNESTVVVFHSAVLSYLSAEERLEFQHTMGRLPCRWIANEGIGVVASAVASLPGPVEERRGQFVLTLDAQPLAWTASHGQSMEWFGGLDRRED